MRAVIVGGSLGGLLAGNMLRSIGWEVDIYERSGDDLASRGAGIGVKSEMTAVLNRIGLVVDDSLGVMPRSRRCLDSAGRIMLEMDRPSVLSSWGRLYRGLKDAFPADHYHFGMSLVSFEDNGDEVTARFADGTRKGADLLVGADGVRSTIRGALMPEVQPHYAGYVAWRGMLNEADMSPELHAAIFNHSVICLPEGEMWAGYPVPGPNNDIRPGHRAFNLVWYHPVTPERLRDMCTDSTGHCHGTSIAPPLIRPEVIAEMRGIARKVMAPQCAEVVERIGQPFFQAIFDLAPPRLVQGRVLLLGDAAFVARPHVGMGVTKAALDAECLADELEAHDNDVAVALARYDAQQCEFGMRVVARSRHIGAHLEAQSKPRELRTPEELNRDPAVVMRESGANMADIPELIELVLSRRAAAAQARSARAAAAGGTSAQGQR
jgi:2-polyprenyl-6-methoxyphenol hydroxylase-like FAD-dependent oxidoreductase